MSGWQICINDYEVHAPHKATAIMAIFLENQFACRMNQWALLHYCSESISFRVKINFSRAILPFIIHTIKFSRSVDRKGGITWDAANHYTYEIRKNLLPTGGIQILTSTFYFAISSFIAEQLNIFSLPKKHKILQENERMPADSNEKSIIHMK